MTTEISSEHAIVAAINGDLRRGRGRGRGEKRVVESGHSYAGGEGWWAHGAVGMILAMISG